jgi:ABC-2 type transport system permease protein
MSLLKTLNRILSIVGKELVEIIRRPGAILSLILGPFLIMALFGAGFSGYRRPLETVIVIPPESGLPTDADSYKEIAGSGLDLVEVTTDQARAEVALAAQTLDVVIIAPVDAEKNFKAGQRSKIQVKVNAVDPVDQNYAVFLAHVLERDVNRIIVERIAKEGQSYALSAGASQAAAIPPDVVAAPTEAELVNIAPSQPTVVQYFGPAVLALILQHMAVTLIALSIIRERTTGIFELFRVSPISAFEMIFGKLLAFGIICSAIAAVTIVLLIGPMHVPMLGDPALIAGVIGLLILASLGLGLLVAAISDSERQTVQLSLLILLASVFFSGFALAIDQFSQPIRSLVYVLPVTNGIRLLDDLMMRGATTATWQISVLAVSSIAFIAIAWLLLRRAMKRI